MQKIQREKSLGIKSVLGMHEKRRKQCRDHNDITAKTF